MFFKSQVNAQINQLKYLPKDSIVLIVGGGTGWILEEVAKIHSRGLKIVYVEISEKMIQLSQKRRYAENDVQFINQGIEDFESSILFDVILTPFLFDNFSEQRAVMVFEKLNGFLEPNGLWFLVDFSLGNGIGDWWKSLLLNSMYRFFKLLSIVEASQLVEMKPYFSKQYELLREDFYYSNFIKASIFRKTVNTI